MWKFWKKAREVPDYVACPACGFKTSEYVGGSFEYCAVCDWQDDPTQRIDLFSAMGANKICLAEYQEWVLGKEKLVGLNVGDRERDPNWRPIDERDAEEGQGGVPKTGLEWFNSMCEEEDAAAEAKDFSRFQYWVRNS